MNRFGLTLAGAALAVAGLIGTASAQVISGYTLPGAYLRAGPSTDYPLISALPPGAPTAIYGCLDGWSWCDVDVQGQRGWTAGPGLQVLYGQQRVGLALYAPRLFVPVIGFDLGGYWGRYYRDRPFFGDRDRWIRVDHDHWNHGGYSGGYHAAPGGGPGFGHDPYRGGAGPVAHPPILGYHNDSPRPPGMQDSRYRGQPGNGGQSGYGGPQHPQPQARPTQAPPSQQPHHDDHHDNNHDHPPS